MLFTVDELEAALGLSLLEEGRSCLSRGAVERLNVQRGGELITALVNGEDGPLRLYIRSRREDARRVEISGECTCHRRSNCQHVAAVLLQALGEGELREPSPGDKSTDSPFHSAESRQQLRYFLTPDIRVECRCVRVNEKGDCTDERPYEPAWALRGIPPRFLSAADLAILRPLHDMAGLVPGRGGERLLRALVESGRCYSREQGEVPVKWGEAVGLTPAWETDDTGNQRIRWQGAEGRFVFPLDSLWYLDPERSLCGPARSDLPKELERELAALAPVPPEQVERLREDLAKRYPGVMLPALRKIEVVQLPSTPSRPCLQLFSDERASPAERAELRFEYHGVLLGSGDPARFEAGRVTRLTRDDAAEQAAQARLLGLGFRFEEKEAKRIGAPCFSLPGEPEVWARFQTHHRPLLEAEGWRVELDQSFRYPVVRGERWYGRVEPAADIEWHRIGIGIEVAGERIDLLPALIDLLRSLPPGWEQMGPEGWGPGRDPVVTLEDGRLLPVPFERLRPILEILFELYDAEPGGEPPLTLSRFQLLRLAELGEDLEWLGGEVLQSLARRLRQAGQIKRIDPPAGLQADLRPYQQQGVGWLQFLREQELAGILADDMGLGKTVQVLAHLLLEKEQGRCDRPSLVVVPTSLLCNWRREAERFAPELRLLTLHGPGRRDLFGTIPNRDLVLTSYPLLIRDGEKLRRYGFHLLILDEAQVIKNPKAKASRTVRRLRARHRLCLTGTPMENHLGELWSLFDFLLPGLLGRERQFRRLIRTPIEQRNDKAAAERLKRRIRPFLLRRTKEAVAAELPPKSEILRRVALEGEQRDLYESIRLSQYELVRQAVDSKGLARSRVTILNALLKLRQVCCDPRLVKLENSRQIHRSAKLELLLMLLPEMIEEGRRILLFSQFTSMLQLIQEALSAKGIEYVKLTGQTQDRMTPVQRFQEGEVPLFLISLKAGGVGLNLTAADTVIHYDPWWNPAVERQATDRAHRIGQENPVFVYKLIAEGSVEEKIQHLQQRKQALADGLYADREAAEPRWSEADLDELFGPPG